MNNTIKILKKHKLIYFKFQKDIKNSAKSFIQ